MDLPSVTYEFYKNDYKGHLSELVFDSKISRAAATVKNLIGSNVPANDAQTLAYERAVCAAIDAYGSAVNGSFSIGSFSMNDSTDYKAEAIESAMAELSTSGLLFGGLR